MILVGCKVIPEIVEVGALPALNKSLGGRSIEAEVPDVRVVVDGFSAWHAWEEGIHQNKF